MRTIASLIGHEYRPATQIQAEISAIQAWASAQTAVATITLELTDVLRTPTNVGGRRLAFIHPDTLQDVPFVVARGFEVLIGADAPTDDVLRTVLQSLPGTTSYAIVSVETARSMTSATMPTTDAIVVEDHAHLLRLLGLSEDQWAPLTTAAEQTRLCLNAQQAGLESGA